MTGSRPQPSPGGGIVAAEAPAGSSSLPATETIIVQNDENSVLYLEGTDDPKQIPILRDVKVEDDNQNKLKSTLGDQIDGQTKIFVVVSILSGARLAASFTDKVLIPLLARLKIHNEQIEIIRTTDANTVTKFTQDTLLINANKGVAQLVILLSGDGGIVDILNALAPRTAEYEAPEISLIPMGTGNALANSTGLTDQTSGLAAMVRGSSKVLPIFKVNFSSGARLLVNEAQNEESLPIDADQDTAFLYGAVVCSWGMHAALVADSDTAEYRQYGVERFKMAANEALYPADGNGPHHYKAKVKVVLRGASDWTDVARTEHAYVLTTLVSNLEKGFTISPASKPLDGSMRIVHFGPMAGDDIMGLMTQAYQGGKHVDEPTVTYEEVDRVHIAFDGLETDSRWRRVCVDGKIVRIESNGWIEIAKLPESLITLRHLS